MSFLMIILTAVSLSMDAFAVAITCGIRLGRGQLRGYLKVALAFGCFQALMPAIGIMVGVQVRPYIESFAHWIIFAIFFLLGCRTLYHAFRQEAQGGFQCRMCQCRNWSCLFSLSVATSIDALFVGVALAFYEVALGTALVTIGLVTVGISLLGCVLGSHSVIVLHQKAQWVAAMILLGLAFFVLFH